MSHIVCLGMAALDSIFRVPSIPTTATKVLASSYIECGGGMAANASVAIARLGGKASYWGRVGADAVGSRIIGELAAESVDIRRARRIAASTSPCSAILIAPNGERLVCVYDDPTLDPDPSWLPIEELATAHATLVDVRWPEGAARLLDAARAQSIPAVLDGEVGMPDILLDLAYRATHSVLSEEGLAQATGTANPGEGLIRLSRSAGGIVGVTLGANGFLWRDGSYEQRVPAPKVDAIDTLGAGDVWHGAFTLALAEGQDVAAAGRFANTAAAIKCTRFGGRMGAPTRAEVELALGDNSENV